MEKAVNRIMLVTLAAAVVFGLLTYFFRNAEHDTITHGERSFVRCDYINVDVTKLPVTVIPYDGENIVVRYENDIPLEFETGDNRLSISESDRLTVSLFTGRHEDYGITICLPDSAYREISLYSGAGDIRVGRANCVRLSVMTDSGDISLENTVSLLKVITTDGLVNIDFDTIITGCDILSRRGDAVFSFPPKSSVEVDFESEYGRCESELWEGVIDGSYNYSLNGGKNIITANFEQGVLTIKEKEQ